MSEAPEFSVVVPTYRRPTELARCLAALSRLDPEGPSFEVLVVDDGGGAASDPAAAAPASAIGWRLIRRPHLGPAAARNAGAREARGRWLAFTDDDCEPRPGWLAGFAARFAEDPAAGLGGTTANLLPECTLARAHQLLVDFVCRVDAGGRATFFASNNLALPAEAFHALGGFDESFPFAAGEDRDLCARFRAAGGRWLAAPEARIAHRHRFDVAEYLRLHFRYGRGARRYRRREAAREGRAVRLEPVRFYAQLVGSPLVEPRPPRALLLSAALLLSQAGHAAGYAWERLREG